MDPALWELLETTADDDEVEAIIRLRDPRSGVPGVRIVARFGPIATCRLRSDAIVRTRADSNVLSLKASRVLGPEPQSIERRSLLTRAPLDGDLRRPFGVAPTGANVCVGAVDWGLDFDHPHFKFPDGTTRLLALFDQRKTAHVGTANPYGYGQIHNAAAINRALATDDPYGTLGYHPADADKDGSGAHGTFVMDVAAGNGSAGGPSGIAPNADLVFVHLSDRGTGGLSNLGDSVRILEAVDFVARTAGRKPWVINLSVGRHGGPHDGTTLAELALDYLIAESSGRAIVQSTGNYFDKACHASGRLAPGASHELTVVTSEDDVTPNELEVWYSGDDEFVVRLESPRGVRHPPVRLGEQADVVEEGRTVGRLYHRDRDPNNCDNHVELFLYPSAPAGAWVITIDALRVSKGQFHAWLERDELCPDCQARFLRANADSRTTTGTIANGRSTIVVGAYNGHSRTRELAPFSSAGPTRDGRRKPDIVAPGVQVLAARSAPRGSRRSPGLLARKSGTSFAAPHVAGAVALCLESTGHPPASEEIRAALLKTADRASPHRSITSRFGQGYLDIRRTIEAVPDFDVNRRAQTDLPAAHRLNRPRYAKELAMMTEPGRIFNSSVGPDQVYRELLYRPRGALSEMLERAFWVLARPGDVPSGPPQPGDLLVRVALGQSNGGRVAVLTAPALVSARRLAAMGIAHEPAGRGLYGTVLDTAVGSGPDAPGSARRILDESGRMPLGQILLRPNSAHVDERHPRLGSGLASEEQAEDDTRTIRQMIDSGSSENDITNALFFGRNPALAKSPIRPGTTQARQWQSIRDREVRPALKARLTRASVDPLLLAMFFSQYEDDKRVPSESKERFLTRAPLLSMGRTLRDRLLSRWRGGLPPATATDCFDLALDISGHAATAALLCHNVTKAFARGGKAIQWQSTATEGEYTDGTRTYTAKVIHSAGRLTWFNAQKNREVRSIYYLIFSAKSFGTFDPGDWYHFFVTATTATLDASGELSAGDRSGRGRSEGEDDDRGGALFQVTRLAYPSLVAESVLDVERQMTDSSLRSAPGYRGWVLGNVVSFLEGGHYGGDQAEVRRESTYHLLGAAFGLRRAGRKAGGNWRWYVPRGGSIDEGDLLTGFSVRSKTDRILDPQGRQLPSTSKPASESEESNGRPTFCERARALAQSHDQPSARLIELLKLPIGATESTKLANRARALTDLFGSLTKDQKIAVGQRLSNPNDPLARLFDCELDRRFRARLRTMLEVPAPPASSPAPAAAASNRCRRELGSITALLPWEREFLAMAHDRAEDDFRSIAILVGPIILPGLMTRFHDVVVKAALKGGYAITLESNVWFPRAIDTRTAHDLAWLVHESVHVVDFATMGTQAFLGTYAMQAVTSAFSHDDIPHERRANQLEAAVERLLARYPDLANLISSCDGTAISADLALRRTVYRSAINEFLAAGP